MTERLDSLKKDSARQLEECRNKIALQEEQQKETQRSRMSAESEFDKQKALLEQKLEFIEKQLDESQKKEKELSSEVKNQKRDHFNNVKDLQSKLEQQVKELNRRVEEQSEQLFEWESKHGDLETKYEQDQVKWDDMEATRGKENQRLRDNLADTQRNYDNLKRKYTEEVDQLRANS